jgi:tetrahydromethanopterin S-methyltransferase subunit H
VSIALGVKRIKEMINKKFSESEFEILQLPKCEESLVYDFLKSINNETLGMKVSIALNQRKQGHFDKAMLNISEANRDQVLAIREI